jgi:hypothetical protein
VAFLTVRGANRRRSKALNDMGNQASSQAPRPRTRRDAPLRLVTDRDRELLAFAAEHRLVLAAQAQTLLGASEGVAYRRLSALTTRGLLKHTQMLHRRPGWYQITRAGLALIGSGLPVPRLDLRCYEHDIGLAWLWLAAARGAFGRVDRIVSEREMRSRDSARLVADRAPSARGEPSALIGDDRELPFGVRLGGVGPGGLMRLHYPDLLLLTGPRRDRVAIELELSSKGRRRLDTILSGYAAEPSVAAVLYLAEKPGIRREIQSSAARLGISDLVRVQRLRSAPATQPAAAPTRARDPAMREALAR